MTSNADFERASEYEPGSNNCLNCSRSASCSGVGAGGCGGRPSDWNQLELWFPFRAADWLLAGTSFKNRSKVRAAVGNPMRTASVRPPLVNPLRFRGKSQPDKELSLPYPLVNAAWICRCRSKKRSTTVKFLELSAVSCSGVRSGFLVVSTPRISAGVIKAQFSRSSSIFWSRCASVRESAGTLAGAGSGRDGLCASKTDTGARTSLAKSGRSENRGISDGTLEAPLSPAGAEKMMGLLGAGTASPARADKTISDKAPARSGVLNFAGRKLIVQVYTLM